MPSKVYYIEVNIFKAQPSLKKNNLDSVRDSIIDAPTSKENKHRSKMNKQAKILKEKGELTSEGMHNHYYAPRLELMQARHNLRRDGRKRACPICTRVAQDTENKRKSMPSRPSARAPGRMRTQ